MTAYHGASSAWIEQHRLELQTSIATDTGVATIMSIGKLVLQVIEVPEDIQIIGGWQIPRLWPSPEVEATFPVAPARSDKDLRALSRAALSTT